MKTTVFNSKASSEDTHTYANSLRNFNFAALRTKNKSETVYTLPELYSSITQALSSAS